MEFVCLRAGFINFSLGGKSPPVHLHLLAFERTGIISFRVLYTRDRLLCARFGNLIRIDQVIFAQLFHVYCLALFDSDCEIIRQHVCRRVRIIGINKYHRIISSHFRAASAV